MSEWISVEDRLPEDGQKNIMVWDGDDGMPYCEFMKGRFYQYEYGFNSEYNDVANITHWMELPKPPC